MSVKAVLCGVPEGSTLGSFLSLLYINNLQITFSKSVVHHFADETNHLFLEKKKLCSIESVIKQKLKLLIVANGPMVAR